MNLNNLCSDCKYYGNEDCKECINCIMIGNATTGESYPSKWVAYNVQHSDKYMKIAKLQEEGLAMYELKNEKYGDSFAISVHKYGLIAALTRMSDKFNRIEYLILNQDKGTEDESLIDSLKDLSNYCNMTIIELEEK